MTHAHVAPPPKAPTPGQFHLLATRRFGPFFVTQFLGAFNDNLFKNALVVLLTFQSAQWTTLAPEVLANVAAGLFILPFFLFSATAGQLADKYDKARLARLVKALEIGIVLIAAAGFALHSLTVLLGALFLLGLHSTLFGPVKYAMLPQQLRPQELVGGNALIEAGTFVAILVGTLAGGVLAALPGGVVWVAVGALAVAVAGYLVSRAIPPAPPPVPDLPISLNPLTETWRNLGFARQHRSVWLAIIAISWFWLYGALLLAQFPALARNVLGGGEASVTLLLATFTIGIGVGSLLCEKLSGHQVEIGLIPIGALGMTLFGLDFALAAPATPWGTPAHPATLTHLLGEPGLWRLLADLVLLGGFGGLFCVPLYAQMQQDSPVEVRARIIAANNILNALFMVVGALIAGTLLGHGLGIPQLFLGAALANGLMLVILCWREPELLRRARNWGRG